jgi:hypothetical protein
MFMVDSLLIGGIRIVLDKIATAVDEELNDESRLREELLAAQMQVELGEIGEEEFASIEAAVLRRLREIRGRREGGPATTQGYRVTGADATFGGDE